jgi:hypothetical protein
MATAAQGAAGRKLRRDVSLLGLMFVLLGWVIESGWLFGALYASQIAGPAAMKEWIEGERVPEAFKRCKATSEAPLRKTTSLGASSPAPMHLS